MMLRRFAAGALSATLLTCPLAAHANTKTPSPTVTPVPVQVDKSVAAPPEILARGWMLTNISTGEILAAGAPDDQYAPASTIKTLTALALLPHLKFEDSHTAVHAEAGAEGSKAGLVEDSVYTVKDLYHGMLLSSGNDTAAALANHVGGLEKATELMNATAAKLGAKNTVAKNTSGLDADGQLTTARDLTLIARAALADPTLAKIFTTRRYQFPGKGTTFDDSRETFQVANHNKLLANYDGATGVKTGYTKKSRHSFIGSAERDGQHLVVTILKAEGRPWRDTIKLLDWGFKNHKKLEAIGTLPPETPLAEPEKPTDEPTAADDTAAAASKPQLKAEPADHSVITQLGIGVGLIVVGLAAALLISRFSAHGRRRPEDI